MELTTDQLLQIEVDANGKRLLTEQEVQQIATKLNEAINLPLLGEPTEQIIFTKIVRRVDELLYQILPNEIYAFIRTIEEGLAAAESETLLERAATWLNAHLNIPWIPEALEQKIFRLIVEIIAWALRKGWNLAMSLARH